MQRVKRKASKLHFSNLPNRWNVQVISLRVIYQYNTSPTYFLILKFPLTSHLIVIFITEDIKNRMAKEGENPSGYSTRLL